MSVGAGVLISGLALSAGAAGGAFARPVDGEKKVKGEQPVPPAKPPVFFVISLNKQHVSVYSSDGLVTQSPVSTGRPGHATPTGLFTILGKERYHYSNIYDGAPMPFMQRLTYSGVAMHEGVLPGYPASHGCVRLPHDFAQWLFGYTKGNERVVISHQDIVPAKISHPKLPTPKWMTLPGSDAIASSSSQMIQSALAATKDEGRGPRVDVAIKADSDAGDLEMASRLLNPLEFAKAMKAKTARQVEQASAAIAPARQAADAKTRDVRAAAIELRKAELAVSLAKDKIEWADRILKRATGDDATKAATAAKETADGKLKEAQDALDAAKRLKTDKDQEAEAAARTLKEAETSRRTAADATKSWNRRLEPLSIFISRKTQRLYVRQGYLKVFDVPVTIRDAEKPIGTHLFLAVSENDGSGRENMRWLALSIPEGTGDDDDARGRYRRLRDDDRQSRAAASPQVADALDRLEMSDEVAERLSEMLWAGASMIISDSGISRETEDFDRTDFVVLTR